MKKYSAEAHIDAAPDVIWQILMDGERYPEWDPNVERVEGRIARGQKVRVFTRQSPGRAFPVTITSLQTDRGMIWSGGMPLGLFKGERTFDLVPNPRGGTDFSVREVFSGPLLPIIIKTMPDLTKSFEDFVNGLKKRAESVSVPI